MELTDQTHIRLETLRTSKRGYLHLLILILSLSRLRDLLMRKLIGELKKKKIKEVHILLPINHFKSIEIIENICILFWQYLYLNLSLICDLFQFIILI